MGYMVHGLQINKAGLKPERKSMRADPIRILPLGKFPQTKGPGWDQSSVPACTSPHPRHRRTEPT